MQLCIAMRLREPAYRFTSWASRKLTINFASSKCRKMPDHLKLMALDADDLAVVSALTQDAVLKSAEIEFVPSKDLLILPLKRFAWETQTRHWLFFKKYQRRLSALRISGITNLKTLGINKDDPDQVLSLLSTTFVPESDNNPSGTLTLTFAGNIEMALQVECIEIQLSDLGAAWAASSKPRHKG